VVNLRFIKGRICRSDRGKEGGSIFSGVLPRRGAGEGAKVVKQSSIAVSTKGEERHNCGVSGGKGNIEGRSEREGTLAFGE